MSDLEDMSQHLHDKISSLRSMVDLSAAELPQNKMEKLGKELLLLEGLLEEFEKCVDEQKEQLKHLKKLELLFLKNEEDLQDLKENIPAHMPRKKEPSNEPVMVQKEASEVQNAPPLNTNTTKKRHIREMDFITMSEFEGIPPYMKGRASYDQLNAVVQSINTTVAAKYKILHQSAKSLNNHSRKLHQRFKEQETKDTKGQYFVVEEDIREFTQMKVDKRFQGILNMLRHCQRLKEVRGGGLTRYMLL